MIKFLSDEWVDQAKNIVSKNLDPETDLNNANTSVLNIINNVPPDGHTVYFFLAVKNGKITELLVDKTGSLSEKNAEFMVTGNYATFVQIFRGEMKTLIALIKNRVKIKGDKMKALQFVKSIDKITFCLREIETEFEEV